MFGFRSGVILTMGMGIFGMTAVAGPDDDRPVWRSPHPASYEDSSSAPSPLPLQPKTLHGIQISVVPPDGHRFPRLDDNLFLEELIPLWGMNEKPIELFWQKSARSQVNRAFTVILDHHASELEKRSITGSLLLQGDSLLFLRASAEEVYFLGAVREDNTVVLSSMLEAEAVGDELHLKGTAETFSAMAIRHITQRALACGVSASGIACGGAQLAELSKLASTFASSQSAELQVIGNFITARGPMFAQTLQTCRAAGLDAESLGMLVAAFKSHDGLAAALPGILFRVGSRLDVARFSGALGKLVEGTVYESWLNYLNGIAGTAQGILNLPHVQMIVGCARNVIIPGLINRVIGKPQ